MVVRWVYAQSHTPNPIAVKQRATGCEMGGQCTCGHFFAQKAYCQDPQQKRGSSGTRLLLALSTDTPQTLDPGELDANQGTRSKG